MIDLPSLWPTNPWPTSFRTVRGSDPEYLPPGMQFLTVNSPALLGRGDLALYESPAADHDAPATLVVLLHGVYGSFWNWAFQGGAHRVLDALLVDGEIGPIVLAMPSDGLSGEGTAYLPHGDTDYEAWIIDDVTTAAREAMSSLDESSPLALVGNSMGGFGAVRLGARHHDRVAAIAAHSPVVDLDDLALFTRHDIGHAAGFSEIDRSLLSMIEPHRATMPPTYVDCGASDLLIDTNRAFHDRLLGLGIEHRYEEYDGGHDWPSWHRRLAQSLRFVDRALTRPT